MQGRRPRMWSTGLRMGWSSVKEEIGQILVTSDLITRNTRLQRKSANRGNLNRRIPVRLLRGHRRSIPSRCTMLDKMKTISGG